MTRVQIVTASELKERLDRGTVAEFWNALTDDYFSGEMIPGSRRVPVDQVGREVTTNRQPKGTEIVVYCSGPSCPQSEAAAQKLVELGFTNVYLFRGGLEAWQEAGFAVEMESAASGQA